MTENNTALLGFMDTPSEEFNNCTLSMIDSEADQNSLNQNDTPYSKVGSCPPKSLTEFFASREGVLLKSLEEVKAICLKERDGSVHNTWLLTEIDYWDNEKERLVVLTDESILTIKYDFIAEKALIYNRISIKYIDRIIQGNLTYPNKSFIPSRNKIGVRAMWNKGKPLSFLQRWNPFNEDIPWTTFTSHPLYYDKDQQSPQFSVENFCSALRNILDSSAPPIVYQFESSPVMVENYLNIPAVIHNSNHLGYFKFRGKVSF